VAVLEAAGKTFCAFAILQRAENRWFAESMANPLGATAEP
jgi:hypothetical protein